jgi:hypothetical protein
MMITVATLLLWLWVCRRVVFIQEPIPRRVNLGDAVNFKLVACGMYHTLALTTSGAVWAWGDNAQVHGPTGK